MDSFALGVLHVGSRLRELAFKVSDLGCRI